LPEEKTTILFMGVAHALDHSFLVALPPVLLLIVKDLNISLGEAGFAATLAYLLFGAGALVGGPLSDRIGEGKIVFVSLALAGASTLILLLDKGFSGLVAVLALTAAWTSFYHPTANSLISKKYRLEMGRVMGIHGVFGSVGQIFIPSAAVFLALVAGWRFPFIFFGVLSMIVSVYFAKLHSPRNEKKGKGITLLTFKDRRFWALLLCNVTMGLYYRGTELFFPAYLTRVTGMSVEASGIAISFLMAFGVLGQFLGGIGGDRIGNARALVIESAGISIGFAALQLQGLVASTVFLFLFGIAFYATQPTTNALTAEIASPEDRGLIYGIMFFTVFGLGSISSAIAGEIAENTGLQPAFTAMFIVSLVALASSFLLIRIWHIRKAD
jgi:MFS family permease